MYMMSLYMNGKWFDTQSMKSDMHTSLFHVKWKKKIYMMVEKKKHVSTVIVMIKVSKRC